jgi:hypothetical protein
MQKTLNQQGLYLCLQRLECGMIASISGFGFGLQHIDMSRGLSPVRQSQVSNKATFDDIVKGLGSATVTFDHHDSGGVEMATFLHRLHT